MTNDNRQLLRPRIGDVAKGSIARRPGPETAPLDAETGRKRILSREASRSGNRARGCEWRRCRACAAFHYQDGTSGRATGPSALRQAAHLSGFSLPLLPPDLGYERSPPQVPRHRGRLGVVEALL